MPMTRAALMALALELVDATTATGAWSPAQARTWLGDTHWDEWANILNRNPYTKYASRTVTQDTNGQFTKASLDVTTVDAMQTHYRIMSVYDQASSGNGLLPAFYQQSTVRMYPVTPYAGTLPYIWTEIGDSLQVLPITAGSSLTVLVNWRPTRADLLSTDSVNVDFPDGYESILAFECAARMLLRAGRETSAAMDHKMQAEEKRQRLLRDLGRIGMEPMRMRAADDLGDWGSQ